MNYGSLRDYFLGVGAKRLSGVDAEPKISNQHEIGTTKAMRRNVLHEDGPHQYEAVYIWLGHYEDDQLRVEGAATHYDTRAGQPNRSPEWRLYYPRNAVTEAMSGGDALFLALHRDDRLYFVVAPEGSNGEQQLSWLFGVEPDKRFDSRELPADGPELDYAAKYILREIGLELEDTEAATLDTIIERFGTHFPTTRVFSQAARDSLSEVDSRDDPDAALLAWLDREEAMFRRLERRIVARQLELGFAASGDVDVDRFLKFSLGVHNRRKSRMGYALENHIEAVFKAHNIDHERGAKTEQSHRPDFLFPNSDVYEAAPAAGAPYLAMLGAKSTCKERWRQVLAEANKIPKKHLLTLEPRITEPQTDQMAESHLQLVVPRLIQVSYTEAQRAWLWDFAGFIRYVGSRA